MAMLPFGPARPLRRTAVVLTGVVASVALGLLAAPAQAAAPAYVALGDSYSSGVGTRTYIADGTSCLRSIYAYPSLIASANGYALNLRACSGAKVADVTNTQLSALSASTAYVTLSVGGNDAGFTSVLTTCALPSWLSNCNGAVDGAQRFIRDTLPASLATLYASIRAKAPNAVVTVAGYPRLFNGQDCNLLTWFAPSEETRLNQTADQINAVIAAQAGAHGFGFANPTSVFIGHAVCGSPEWLNGLSNPVTESYHPNRTGHASGYTPLVSTSLVGAGVRVTSATLARAAAGSDRLARQQRSYAARDRSIRPEVFVAPDLTTPQARAAAARAGVDLSSRASIDRVDRLWAERQYQQWKAKHPTG